ncbi:ribose 5-phosphate isomerase [Annulohypoxylon maeteangense]|uniref:ribose 5-phosphate isomerase n=1 Tax=Annulohypoxylon maeteangense TaxID=1927788 RepID=UPI002007C2C1|nr:ribose 5-phosphate isomerase [Annulohypoxylon maeteangense]KAI0889565.1 ribose 5-phosphate isomerase [Annulohypoxylon maeteangense]
MNPSLSRAVASAPTRLLFANPRAVFRGYPVSGISVTYIHTHTRLHSRSHIQTQFCQRNPRISLTSFSTSSTKKSSMASTTDLIESAKRAACRQAVADHFSPTFTYVGIGSGSTVAYVVEAIAELGASVTSKMKFVPTGSGSTALIKNAGMAVLQVPDLLTEVGYDPETTEHQPIDIYFDGADEVDAELNCIKGGGACHFQEKLVSRLSKRFICVADSRKKVDRLLTSWAYVPVEVTPVGAEFVRRELLRIGSKDPKIRTSGPTFIRTITDNHNHIIDAPFPKLLLNSEKDKLDPANGLWTPDALLAKIKSIFGVLEVGIFTGFNGPDVAKLGTEIEGVKPVKAYFGRSDGQVETLG